MQWTLSEHSFLPVFHSLSLRNRLQEGQPGSIKEKRGVSCPQIKPTIVGERASSLTQPAEGSSLRNEPTQHSSIP